MSNHHSWGDQVRQVKSYHYGLRFTKTSYLSSLLVHGFLLAFSLLYTCMLENHVWLNYHASHTLLLSRLGDF